MSDELDISYTPPEPETVYDGWYRWRARVVPWKSPIRSRDGYRFVMERQFGGFSWEQIRVSRWFEERQKCEREARVWLASHWYEGDLV